MKRFLLLVMAFSVIGCREETTETDPPVRSLKVHEVAAVERASQRKFPAVLEASRITTLSFEVAGKLQEVALDVGQRVQSGETLASLDPASLQLEVDNATAALTEARASARYAQENADRQQELFQRGSVTKVVADDARTQQEIAQATVVQAQTALDSALENLNKASIKAPFDGIINSVEVQSFGTVAAGTPVAQLYPSDSFEVAFSVNFDTVSRLVVGKPAPVRLADKPDIVIDAFVSEIGSRADAVSSFPIVLKLRETYPLLKAGMAVEVAMEFELPAEEGFTIPLSTLVNDGKSHGNTKPGDSAIVGIYVFDPQTSTVRRRDITVSGIRGNQLIVTDGLQVGEKVASAGVSFLREGQQVKLLDGEG